MPKSDTEYGERLQKLITYGINLSFNKLIDEKRKNNEKFVFMKDGKIVHVDANDVNYRELKIP
jgi:hypothetical protein